MSKHHAKTTQSRSVIIITIILSELQLDLASGIGGKWAEMTPDVHCIRLENVAPLLQPDIAGGGYVCGAEVEAERFSGLGGEVGVKVEELRPRFWRGEEGFAESRCFGRREGRFREGGPVFGFGEEGCHGVAVCCLLGCPC